LLGTAVTAYGLTALACLLAMGRATRRGRGRGLAELRHWAGCAAFFVALATARIFDVEERGRSTLRALAQDANLYANRWSWQAPLAAIATLGAIVLLALAIRTFPGAKSKKRLAIWISRQAVLAFVTLFAMRMISLHAIDSLLYAGPIRLNWLLDGGLTLTVLIAAVVYALGRRAGYQ
jgi:hypothetical protein